MSDRTEKQGLSIFDEEPDAPDGDEMADEPTQMIPAISRPPKDSGSTSMAPVPSADAGSKTGPATGPTTGSATGSAKGSASGPDLYQGAPDRGSDAPAAPAAPTDGGTAEQPRVEAATRSTPIIPPRAAPSRPAAGTGRVIPRPASPLAAPGSAFPQARRGYDKDAVDRRLREMSGEKDDLTSSLDAAREQVSGLERQLDELERDASEAQSPSYAGLGGRASELLRLAEEQAREVIDEAHARAGQIREQATKSAAATRLDAQRETDELRSSTQRELDEQRVRHQTEVEQARNASDAEGADIKAAAQREADQMRLSAQQEVTSIRTGGTREAEQLRAAVDREVQEARRALAVEKERLAREAVEHHTSATNETTRLVREAEERATGAEDRARTAMDTAAGHREQAGKEADGLLARARAEAEQVLTSARAEAEELRAAGHAEHDRQLREVTGEVDAMSKRRDAIAAQLGSLRDVVAGFASEAAGEAAAGSPAEGSPDK